MLRTDYYKVSGYRPALPGRRADLQGLSVGVGRPGGEIPWLETQPKNDANRASCGAADMKEASLLGMADIEVTLRCFLLTNSLPKLCNIPI